MDLQRDAGDSNDMHRVAEESNDLHQADADSGDRDQESVESILTRLGPHLPLEAPVVPVPDASAEEQPPPPEDTQAALHETIADQDRTIAYMRGQLQEQSVNSKNKLRVGS